MRILHVIKSLSSGGASRSLCSIAKSLRHSGLHRHELISLLPADAAPRELARAAGFQIFEMPDRQTTRRLLEEADIVHVEWWNSPVMYEFLRSELPPCRLLVYAHVAGDTIPSVLTRQLVDFSDFCIACCPYAGERSAIRELPPGLRELKTGVVLATADFDHLSGLSPQPHPFFNIGYIGTVDFRKMHRGFVRMSAAVKVPNARFIVCGEGHLDLLRQQAGNLSATDRFEFRGFVADIRPVLEMLDVYGYPLGENPGAELNIQEVMFAGVPPVVFPLGGLRDLIVHESTGLVVQTEAEYTQALEFLYREPEVRERLGRNAALHARAHFGGERSARELKIIYERMMLIPKHRRHWCQAADLPDLPANHGALSWIDSLGEAAEPFRRSFSEPDLDAVMSAEREIARLYPRAVWGIEEYLNRHPKDSHLPLWLGLTRFGEGRHEEACAALERAGRNGLKHWRIDWYRALSLERLNRTLEATELCRSVLRASAGFTPAVEFIERHQRFPNTQDC